MGLNYFVCFVVFSVLYQTSSSSVSPDNEDESSWLPFMEDLDLYSGLGKETHEINDINCPTTTCIVNAAGNIVWDIRMQLYSENMAQYIEEQAGEDATISLDGCLNSTEADYQACMDTVRERMREFLKGQFDDLFREQLEENCDEENFSTNCGTA